jgi:diguanylate cyclase (GGDEF)-like protein
VGEILRLHLLFGVLIYSLSVAGLWWTSNRVMEDNLRKWAVQWITELEELGVPLYSDRDNERYVRVERFIKKFPEISYVRYYTEGGQLLFTGKNDSAAAVDDELSLSEKRLSVLSDVSSSKKPYLLEENKGHSFRFRAFAPVWVESISDAALLDLDFTRNRMDEIQVVGFVELGMDFHAYRKQLVHNIFMSSIVFAVMFACVLLIGRKALKKALKPLSDLQAPLAQLAKGVTNIKVRDSGHREIRVIARALNRTIEALNERNETLTKLANHDSLTGLANRHHFSSHLKNALMRTTNSALLFVDLDQFKYVNDALGHATGDRLLVQVARCLKNNLCENHVVARFGGDEFTILLHDTSKERATEIAESLLNALQDFTFLEEGHAFNVTCSVGITMVDSDKFTPDELLSHADIACHEAKRRGRNCWHIYEPSGHERENLASDIGWSRRIVQALKNDLFLLEYQPIIHVASGRQEMYEVLLRMRDEKGKAVAPNSFMPAAVRFGLMSEIDHWVIEKAMDALAGFREQGTGPVFTINLSGHIFDDPKLVTTITNGLAKSKLPPSSFVFEITEEVAIRHIARANILIRKIIDLGCQFALDDFGTGFSSLNYLKHLPVKYIKIDGNFVENMASDSIDQAMVRSIIEVAKTVGKMTIAEYVQDARTLEILHDLGIDYAQGYHIGEPRPMLANEPFPVPARRAGRRKKKTG